MNSRRKYSTIILLTVGILVLINILAAKYFFRLDFTEDKRYTLSNATEDILKDIIEPVTIRAYFSGNLPPQLDNIRRDFRDMLVEYTQASKGMVVYEFIDPLDEEGGDAKAQQEGIMQMQVQVREKDQLKAQIAYMGAVIEMGESKEAIPVIQSASGMEYSLTSSIKKLSITEKPIVGFLTGHGEAGLSKLRYAMRDLLVLYQVEEVQLNDSTEELSKYNTIVVLGPTDSIPQNHLEQLSQFVSRGGNLLAALNRVDAQMNQGYNLGISVNTGLESWLNSIGVDVNNNFVVDANAVTVMATMQQGPFTVQRPLLFPYIPTVNNFGDHPVVSGLEQVILNFVSSINYSGDSSVVFTPLLLSSEMTTTKPASGYIDLGYQWSENDFQLSGLTLAAALEGPILGSQSKMVVIADADFPVSEGQQEPQPDNISLLVNAVDWLSDDTGLIELRTQGATARPIDELEDGEKAFLKYLNFLLPILLAVGYGILRAQHNRILRYKRREIGYV
ncbi:MAG: Gldg family protein [Bacteroidales bacterium]|nr:Gldg family protein [Bacteroidales bacterium]MBN2818956.1 Gldg family protein [Bacteroidales bacterium]